MPSKSSVTQTHPRYLLFVDAPSLLCHSSEVKSMNSVRATYLKILLLFCRKTNVQPVELRTAPAAWSSVLDMLLYTVEGEGCSLQSHCFISVHDNDRVMYRLVLIASSTAVFSEMYSQLSFSQYFARGHVTMAPDNSLFIVHSSNPSPARLSFGSWPWFIPLVSCSTYTPCPTRGWGSCDFFCDRHSPKDS